MKLKKGKKDIELLKGTFSPEFLSHLEEEFAGLYDYYCYDEHSIEDFKLDSNQAICIFENDEEVEVVLAEPMEIEYIERIVVSVKYI